MINISGRDIFASLMYSNSSWRSLKDARYSSNCKEDRVFIIKCVKLAATRRDRMPGLCACAVSMIVCTKPSTRDHVTRLHMAPRILIMIIDTRKFRQVFSMTSGHAAGRCPLPFTATHAAHHHPNRYHTTSGSTWKFPVQAYAWRRKCRKSYYSESVLLQRITKINKNLYNMAVIQQLDGHDNNVCSMHSLHFNVADQTALELQLQSLNSKSCLCRVW